MKRPDFNLLNCFASVGLVLFLLCPAIAMAQFQFRPNNQRYQYPQQRYQQYPQQRYQQYPQQRYQQYPGQLQQRPQQQYQPQQQPPVAQQQTSGPTPASVLRYAIKPTRKSKFPRMVGEFESQKAILLSVSDLMYQHNGVLAEIIEKSSGQGVPFVILYNDNKQLQSTVELLDSIGCDLSHVSLLKLNLDTIWLRDFGPRIAELEDGSASSIDFYYNGQRPLDDKFPVTWSDVTNAKSQRIKWTIQGGNLFTNGQGFAITTSRLFEDNAVNFGKMVAKLDVEFERRKIVVDAFKEECNIDRLLILEPLTPEATKHVDMFSVFVAPDKIVVAKVDPRVDPQNARILDYNVKLLEQVKVDGKPLQVERIEFPPRNGKYWSPYTNVILANNLLLMPVYKTDPPRLVQKALETYRRILPGYHVDTVDMTSMQKLEGALHCMSINVPEFAELPKARLSMDKARAYLSRSGVVAKKKANPNSKIKTSSNVPIVSRPQSNQNPQKDSELVEVNGTLKTPDLNSPKTGFGSNPKSVVSQPLTSVDPAQLAAAMTYRRKFVDQSRTFALDAFAIGFQPGQLVLLKTGQNQTSMIAIERLSDEDKVWLSRNASKIRANGEKVKRFVISNRL